MHNKTISSNGRKTTDVRFSRMSCCRALDQREFHREWLFSCELWAQKIALYSRFDAVLKHPTLSTMQKTPLSHNVLVSKHSRTRLCFSYFLIATRVAVTAQSLLRPSSKHIYWFFLKSAFGPQTFRGPLGTPITIRHFSENFWHRTCP